MRGYMFRNRWGALLFVGMTLAGVATLVGTGRKEGAIQQAAEQIARQRAQADRLTTSARQSAPRSPAQEATTVVLIPDEELIDSTEGVDPSPADDFGTPPDDDLALVPQEEVIIVSRDATGPEQTGLQQ